MLGVHAHEDRFVVHDGFFGDGVQIADATATEGHVNQGVADGFVDAQFERAERRFNGQAFKALDEGVALQAEFDQVGNRAEEQIVFGAEFFQFRKAGHGAVFGHDLDDGGGGMEAGEAAKIDASFGLSGAFEDAAGPGASGKICPGRHRSLGLVAASRRTLMVVARSAAETPVVIPKRGWASTEMVKAVPNGAVLLAAWG